MKLENALYDVTCTVKKYWEAFYDPKWGTTTKVALVVIPNRIVEANDQEKLEQYVLEIIQRNLQKLKKMWKFGGNWQFDGLVGIKVITKSSAICF